MKKEIIEKLLVANEAVHGSYYYNRDRMYEFAEALEKELEAKSTNAYVMQELIELTEYWEQFNTRFKRVMSASHHMNDQAITQMKRLIKDLETIKVAQ